MNIGLYTLRAVAFAITDPTLVFVLILLAFMFYRQNKKTAVMQKMILGERMNSPLELTVSQIVIGIFAGAVGSLLLSYLGIMFREDSAIDLIFLLSILLMFIRPRFICFSYSGGILGFTSVLLAALSKVLGGRDISFMGTTLQFSDLNVLKIDVVALLSLIAVLHFVEGLLVFFDGKRGAVPVFTNRGEDIIGGFVLQRYWPIPIALFVIAVSSQLMVGQQVPMPDWWPLVKTSIPETLLKTGVVLLTSFYGVLGFNSVTFTKTKEQKMHFSGGLIMIYAVVLFGVAQLGRYGITAQFFAVLFAPLAHEGMLFFQRYLEMKGTPKYMSGDHGIVVLEVAPNSPAFKMGIRSGDLLLEVNHKDITQEEDILKAINESRHTIGLKIRQAKGMLKEVVYQEWLQGQKLGIVFVPRGIPKDSLVVKYNGSKFKDVFDRAKDSDDEE